MQDHAYVYITTLTQGGAQQAFVSRLPSSKELNISARKAGLEPRDMRRITIAFAGKTFCAGAVVLRAAHAFRPLVNQRV